MRSGAVWAFVLWCACRASGQPSVPDCDGWVPIGAPVERQRAAVVVDEARDRIVVFGGRASDLSAGVIGVQSYSILGDTWEWDGNRWYAQELAGPTSRVGVAACFDPLTRRVVLAGGEALAGSATGSGTLISSEVWSWSGEGWQQSLGQGGPPGTVDGALCADPERGRLLRFGGYAPNGSYETLSVWSRDVAGWHEYPRGNAANGPPLQQFGSVRPTVFDRTRRRLIVVDGSSTVWEWVENEWTRLTPPGGNPCGGSLAMTFDPASGQTLAIAGCGGPTTLRLYSWDGTSWTNLGAIQGVSVPSSQPVRQMNLIAFRGALWLAGSLGDPPTYATDGSSDQDLLRFASLRNVGDHWVAEIQPGPPHPPTTGMHGLVYDRTRGGVVCVGGTRGGFGPDSYLPKGTWLLRGERWAPISGGLDFRDRVIGGQNAQNGRARLVYNSRVYELSESGWVRTPILTAANNSAKDYPYASDPVGGFDLCLAGPLGYRIAPDAAATFPLTGPLPPSDEGGMAYDPNRGAFVMNCIGGTYQFRDGAWSTIQTSLHIDGYPRLVFDPTRNGVIAAGGWRIQPGYMTYPQVTLFLPSGGAAWQTLPLRTPPSRKYARLVWDPDAQRVVYSGGSQHTEAYFRDTWKLAKGPASIGIPPAAVTVLLGQNTAFEVVARGGGVLHYQWRRDGVALQEGANYRGVDTDLLTVFGVEPADVGRYDVVVSNRCGAATSPYATLKLVPGRQCQADIANYLGQPIPDERVNQHDLALFADYFVQGDLRADVGGIGGVHVPDGAVDTNDWVVYLDLFFDNCAR